MGLREDRIREWFLSYKIPDRVAKNEWLMERWEYALNRMTIGSIWSFYVCADIKRFEGDKYEDIWRN